jgi:hypothetical protein
MDSGAAAALATAQAPDWKPDRWPSAGAVSSQAASAAGELLELAGPNREARKRNRVRGRKEEEIAQCAILHDIFGNPFRPVALDPAWLQWDGGTVRKIAQAIYDDRAFDRLPVLADALEEAGCADRDLLDHCRSGGEHVRGCWAVDLLLGKQ